MCFDDIEQMVKGQGRMDERRSLAGRGGDDGGRRSSLSEVEGTEGKGRRTEDGRHRTENRGQRAEILARRDTQYEIIQ